MSAVYDTVKLDLGDRGYSIEVGSGTLDSLGQQAKQLGLGRSVMLISDSNVNPLYGEQARASLTAAGFSHHTAVFEAGEGSKHLSTISMLFDSMVEAGLDRKSSVVALGGGVVGDIAGFAAACYMRGVFFIQVPTTLLAMIDSSVGGKTGVDHPGGKNLIGAFHQPQSVLIDIDTLKTLPPREIRTGMAEMIKHGVIWSEALLEKIENSLEDLLAIKGEVLGPIIAENCRIKAQVVEKDEREAGLRAILNYGHTVGHALESITGYSQYTHGEAVAVGMLVEARVAQRMGIFTTTGVERIQRIIERTGLPTAMPELDEEALMQHMRRDKKAREGRLNLALPTEIGHAEVFKDVDASLIIECLHK
jgi:3-dehydroquinate synthase